MKCTVCNHPQLHDIDLALLSGRQTLKSLHQQYGPGKSSLFRHRKHLVAKLRRSREDLESSQAQVSLLKLNAFLDHVQRGVEAAAAAGDLDRVFKGSHIGSRIIHQIDQMEVPLELATVYRLISTPGFVSQDAILPTGPQIITELHQALVDQAFFPCPDSPPEIVAAAGDEDKNDHDALGAAADADDDCGQEEDAYGSVAAAGETGASDISPDSFLETRNPKLETQQSQLEALRLLEQHFPGLDFSAAAVALAEKDPKPQRDASATQPRQTGPHAKNILENQQDDCYEKNCPKHPNVGRESAAPPAILASEAPATAAAAPPPLDSFLETQNSKLETAFPIDPWSLAPDHSHSDPSIPDPGPADLDHPYLKHPGNNSTYCLAQPCEEECSEPTPGSQSLQSENQKVRAMTQPAPTENPAPAESAPAAPDLALLFSNSADDLFAMTHGYYRHNPPKHIPNRRRDEDFRSSSIFGDPRKIFG